MKQIIIVIILLVSHLDFFAQSDDAICKLSGKVILKENTVGGILITVEGKNLGTLTDSNGQFELDVPVGSQTIMFRLNGLLRFHETTEFVAGSKYFWDTNIGPRYNNAHLIQMKNEGREDELELSTVKISTYTPIKGTIGFDEMKLGNVVVTIKETGETCKSDANGEFMIWALAGMQTIEFNFRGFEPFSHKLMIDNKKKISLKATFGPAYSKEFVEKKKLEGKANELVQSSCEIITEE